MKKFLSILLCIILVMSVFNASFADEEPEERCGPPCMPNRTLTISMEGEGEVDPGVGEHDYLICREVTLTATDTECYEFVRWEGDLGPCTCDCCDDQVIVRTVINPEDPSIDVYMCCDRDITAVFRLKTRYLTVTSEGPGSTEPMGADLAYDCGEMVDIDAIASDCAVFVGWEGDFGENLATDPSITVPMDMDRDITAVFRLKTRYLTVTSEGPGSTDPMGTDMPYDCGEMVDIDAIASDCAVFVGWEDDFGENIATDPSISVPMDMDRDIHAVFETIEYTLGVSHVGQGTVIPTDGAHYYDCGTIVDLSAEPDDCWKFSHWIGDVASSGSAQTTVEMDKSQRVRAVFVEDPCPCEKVELYLYVYEGNGEVSPAGLTEHGIGTTEAIFATPDPGWKFVTWRGGDGQITSWLTTESSVIMNQSTTVAAVFAPIATSGDCTLTVTHEGDGYTDPTGTTVVSCGSVEAIEAVADSGWYFEYWTGPVADMYDATTTVAVVQDTTVHAVFYPDSNGERYRLEIEIEGNGDVSYDDGTVSGVHDGNDISWHATGAIVELDPDADSGWYFYRWEGPDSSDVNSDEIVMDEDKELTAVFRRRTTSSSSSGGIFIQHTLSISVEGNGTVDPFVGSKKYTPGSIVDLSIDPAVGWTFVGWFGPDGGAVVNEQIEMAGDRTLIARFEETTPPPPVEPPEIVIPLVETPLGGGDLPDTSQAVPLANLLVGFYMVGLGVVTKKNKL
jgi:uncharacterized repeat protein (TIGR02543 family)